jgi:hypothetical protein
MPPKSKTNKLQQQTLILVTEATRIIPIFVPPESSMGCVGVVEGVGVVLVYEHERSVIDVSD